MRRREFLGASRRRGGVAARGARAAGDAGGRISASTVAGQAIAQSDRGVPPRPERSRLRRGPQRRHRISLGRRSLDRLPALAADLIRAGGRDRRQRRRPRCAAKAATTTMPIVFVDRRPIRSEGLVASLNRPGGNVTGVSFLAESWGKAAGAAARARTGAATIAVLVDPQHRRSRAEGAILKPRRRPPGSELYRIRTPAGMRDLEPAFASHGRQKAGALIIGAGAFFIGAPTVVGGTGGAPPAAGDLPHASLRGRRPDELRHQHHRCYRQGGIYVGADSQRREAGRPAGACSRPSSNS